MYSSGCDGLDSRHRVGIDEAVVRVSAELSVSVWSQSNECSQVSSTALSHSRCFDNMFNLRDLVAAL